MILFRCIWFWLLSWMAVSCLPASAATLDDLYETAQPVESSQDAALLEALKTVVVRVSGQRDAAERLGPALSNPRQYVQRFGITEDNVLQVGFDDVSIERLLTDAGLPIWGRERPMTLVVLSLDESGGQWASFDISPADKERVARTARARGLPLQWGTLDAQDRNVLSMSGDAAALLPIATRNGANAILVGRGHRDALQWSLATVDGTEQTNGTLEDGVHLAADSFAKVFSATGSSLAHVIVDVAGIVDLDAYASTLNYLEGMTLVRSVAVQSMSGDTMQFKLAVRGDGSTLERAIALDRRLVPMQGAITQTQAAMPESRLAFRYQP